MDVEIDVEVAVDVEVEVEISVSDAVCQQLINKTCITHARCGHLCIWPISNRHIQERVTFKTSRYRNIAETRCCPIKNKRQNKDKPVQQTRNVVMFDMKSRCSLPVIIIMGSHSVRGASTRTLSRCGPSAHGHRSIELT